MGESESRLPLHKEKGFRLLKFETFFVFNFPLIPPTTIPN